MILTPSITPPSSFHTNSVHAQVMPTNTQAQADISVVRVAAPTQEQVVRPPDLQIPTVMLDMQTVTHPMAAALATSLLGHVLFLKSQIPFPVVQLSRVAVGHSNTRAAKRCQDLLSAFDALSSHLLTTFTALSTAIALRGNTSKGHDVENQDSRTCAHLAFVLGPSIGAARARVMLVIDGLEVKMWGMRDDRGSQGPSNESDESGDETSEDGNEDEDDGDDDEIGSDDESSNEDEVSEVSESDRDEDYESSSEKDSGSAPESHSSRSEHSSSRSMSPSPPSSTPPSPADPLEVEKPHKVMPLSPAVPRPTVAQKTPATFLKSHAEEQQALRSAERLLSRTLADACAEDGGGISSELSPSQTHVLLRAPRRFAHPAWIPKQNLTRSLEGVLTSFLNEAYGGGSSKSDLKRKPVRTGVKTEGVWVGCRRPSEQMTSSDPEDTELEEDDEMIWWAWDGKIVGFSDW